jgi:hypothetical protein
MAFRKQIVCGGLASLFRTDDLQVITRTLTDFAACAMCGNM